MARTDDGRFDRLALLGAGAMGEAWLVRDGVAGREVVLKRALAPEGEAAARLLDEVAALRALAHPAFPAAYDAGSEEDGTPWFTMACAVCQPCPDAET